MLATSTNQATATTRLRRVGGIDERNRDAELLGFVGDARFQQAARPLAHASPGALLPAHAFGYLRHAQVFQHDHAVGRDAGHELLGGGLHERSRAVALSASKPFEQASDTVRIGLHLPYGTRYFRCSLRPDFVLFCGWRPCRPGR